jgi:ethylbenzene dehydrogenase
MLIFTKQLQISNSNIMKNLKLISLLIIVLSLIFIQCTSEPIPGPPGEDGKDGEDGVSTGPGTSDTELLVAKTLLGPQIDGFVDASWANLQSLVGTTEVPDLDNDVFQGYVGNKQDVSIKAQYDGEYIYFLVEWKDSKLDLNRDTWYFDPDDNLWKQESNKPVFDDAGNKIREAFYEDKFAMQWDIDNTVTDWDSQTCFATCHTGLSEDDGYARHYTVAPGQQTDMWHWKSVRTGLPNGQFDDKHVIDNVNNPVNKTRAGDAKESGGYVNNRVTLLLDGNGAEVKVPQYYIPEREYYYWITQNEIDSGIAREIVAVASDGKLTDEDGNIIDPVAEVKYQRDGETTGAYGMPSIHTSPFVGSRGDLISASNYTGNGWILEFKRKLFTGNPDDVVFNPANEYPFGYATFDNAAIAHGIKAFMILKFEQ